MVFKISRTNPEAFVTIVSCQLLYALTFRHYIKSLFSVGLLPNKYLIGAVVQGLSLQLLVLGIPFMQEAFKLQMLDSRGWVNVILLGLVPIVLNEISKALMRRRVKKHGQHN